MKIVDALVESLLDIMFLHRSNEISEKYRKLENTMLTCFEQRTYADHSACAKLFTNGSVGNLVNLCIDGASRVP